MQKIHQYEHEGDAPVHWYCRKHCELRVISGRLWLTIEGRKHDHWLDAGATLSLPANSRLWLSAHPQARFELRDTAFAQPRVTWRWLARRLSQAARSLPAPCQPRRHGALLAPCAT